MAPRFEPQSDSDLIRVIDLGRMEYAAALSRQIQARDAVLAARVAVAAGSAGGVAAATGGNAKPPSTSPVEAQVTAPPPMPLLLVEHDPPVITIGRRPGATRSLIASAERLATLGIELHEADRGGDATYHGPGQLVAYPILDLNRLGLGLHRYMRLLEEVVIRAIARWGVEGHRDPAATGVWVEFGRDGAARGESAQSSDSAKIAAIGIRVSRWISTHGLALNVRPHLTHFDEIIPCGLVGRRVTSLQALLGPERHAPEMSEVKTVLVEEFRSVFGALRA